MKSPVYDEAAGPAAYSHRSGECDEHGVNVPHFRLKNAAGPFYCVACALSMATEQAASNGHADALRPLDDAELHDLLTATLHGDLPHHTMMRVLSTLSEIPRLRRELAQAGNGHGITATVTSPRGSRVVETAYTLPDALQAQLQISGELPTADAPAPSTVQLQRELAIATADRSLLRAECDRWIARVKELESRAEKAHAALNGDAA